MSIRRIDFNDFTYWEVGFFLLATIGKPHPRRTSNGMDIIFHLGVVRNNSPCVSPGRGTISSSIVTSYWAFPSVAKRKQEQTDWLLWQKGGKIQITIKQHSTILSRERRTHTHAQTHSVAHFCYRRSKLGMVLCRYQCPLGNGIPSSSSVYAGREYLNIHFLVLPILYLSLSPSLSVSVLL